VRKVARVRPNEIESYQEFISLAETTLETHGLSPMSTTGFFTNKGETLIAQIMLGRIGHTLTSLGVLVRARGCPVRAFTFQAGQSDVHTVAANLENHLNRIE
jgi:hypothetical protein